MYSTCLFCHRSLGSNEEVEPFPVGGRLAFDAIRGRLWVVCPYCARWNLSPLEERWEAVEACERLFRVSPLRASTDNIGLTRLPGGLELVRVGQALRPELALWRYGRRFRWRRRIAMARQGAARIGNMGFSMSVMIAGSSGAVTSLLGSPGIAMLGAVGASAVVGHGIHQALSRRTVLRLRDDATDTLLTVRARDLPHAELRPGGEDRGWSLRVAHRDGATVLAGHPALRAAGALLARLNHAGAEDHEVRIAARRLAVLPDPRAAFGLVAGHPDALLDPATADRWRRILQASDESDDADDDAPLAGRAAAVRTLERFPRSIRIALEMAAHEERERRAMEGELAALEADWREAERVAAIADDLLLPPAVEDWLRRHRRG